MFRPVAAGDGHFVVLYQRLNEIPSRRKGRDMKLLTGNSNKPLAEAISAKLALPLVRPTHAVLLRLLSRPADTTTDLAATALDDTEVASILGATVGPALHRLARGIDDRPVAERAEAKQISAESTFAADLTTLDQLRDLGDLGV